MFLFWLSSMERASGWVGWLIELHLQVLRMELGVLQISPIDFTTPLKGV